MRAIDLIVNHWPAQWVHVPTGEIHSPVFVSPLEVITISDVSAWLGRSTSFVNEFRPLEPCEH